MVKTVLVTGGAGFVGSHLCDALLAQGNKVICLDNFYTGRPENISHLLQNPNFTLFEHDVTEVFDLQVDEIFNLACPASPPHYQKDPIFTSKTSFLGAMNCLDLATKYNAKVLQASTSEIYGDPHIHPQPENYWGNVNTIGIRSCYDEGKRIAESLFFDFKRIHNIEIKVARIFNTYGPRMDPFDGRVVSNLIVQSLSGKPMTIYGDGSQTRSFCYVEDLVRGLLKLMSSPREITGPINLGNPNEFSMIELATKVSELSGNKLEINYLPLPQDDPKIRQPDIELAKSVLDWEPKIQLDLGLTNTIQYFSEL